MGVRMYKCKHFKLQELMSPIVYNKFGNFAWSFFDAEILKDLDKIREAYGKPITINNWLFGGDLTQCGLRSNMDKMVNDKTTLYCSAHCMGKAFDLHCSNNVRLFDLCFEMINCGELTAFKRLESRQSTHDGWVHIDSFQTDTIVFRV